MAWKCPECGSTTPFVLNDGHFYCSVCGYEDLVSTVEISLR